REGEGQEQKYNQDGEGHGPDSRTRQSDRSLAVGQAGPSPFRNRQGGNKGCLRIVQPSLGYPAGGIPMPGTSPHAFEGHGALGIDPVPRRRRNTGSIRKGGRDDGRGYGRKQVRPGSQIPERAREPEGGEVSQQFVSRRPDVIKLQPVAV